MAPPTALPLPDSEILHPVAQLSPVGTGNRLPSSSQTPTLPDAPLPRPADPTQAKTHSALKPPRSKAVPAPLRRIRRFLGPIPYENYPPPKRNPSPLAGQNPAPRWMLSPTPSELPRLKSASAPTKPVSALRPRQVRPLRDGTKFPLNSRIRHYSGQQAPHGQEKQHSSGDPLPLQSKNRRSLRHSDPTFAQNQRSQERTSPTFVGKRCFRR